MQLDVIENKLQLWAWRPGEARPPVPQVSYEDTNFRRAHGAPGIPMDPSPGEIVSTATFRYVWVADSAIVPTADVDENGMADGRDIDMITAQVLGRSNDPRFDVNQDALVDQRDRTYWVKDLKKTWFGDANLNGIFDSSDLVSVFEAGVYENQIHGDAIWSTGDWNGDREFSSGDLVVAFQDGGYEQGLRPATSTVPEPTSSIWITLLVCLAIARRR
jgi:hypothetical protein